MKCYLCDYQFEEDKARLACRGCPLARTCQMVKCPECGYYMPAEPGLIKVLRSWSSRGRNGRAKRAG